MERNMGTCMTRTYAITDHRQTQGTQIKRHIRQKLHDRKDTVKVKGH